MILRGRRHELCEDSLEDAVWLSSLNSSNHSNLILVTSVGYTDQKHWGGGDTETRGIIKISPNAHASLRSQAPGKRRQIKADVARVVSNTQCVPTGVGKKTVMHFPKPILL